MLNQIRKYAGYFVCLPTPKSIIHPSLLCSLFPGKQTSTNCIFSAFVPSVNFGLTSGRYQRRGKKRVVRRFSPLSPCWLVTLAETVLLPSPQLLSDDSSFCLFLITLLSSLIASGLGFLLWLISGHLTTLGCSPLTSPQGYFTSLKFTLLKLNPLMYMCCRSEHY